MPRHPGADGLVDGPCRNRERYGRGAQSSGWQDVLNSVTKLPETLGDLGRYVCGSFVSPLRPTYEPEIDGAAWGPNSPVGNAQAKQTLGDLGKASGHLGGTVVQGVIENKALKVAGEALRVGSSALDAGEAARGAGAAGREATGFLGHKGFELKNLQAVRNEATEIAGRRFSGHALDQMQNRGIMPSVVENTIGTGTTFPTRAGTTGFFDAANNVRVIVNSETGQVVTVIRGAP